jgi:hypothetical protein
MKILKGISDIKADISQLEVDNYNSGVYGNIGTIIIIIVDLFILYIYPYI